MNNCDETIPTYLVSIRFNDCSVERAESDSLIGIHHYLLKLPRAMNAPTECFDMAEINIYTQADDARTLHKRAGDLYFNFLTELNFAVAEQMGIKL